MRPLLLGGLALVAAASAAAAPEGPLLTLTCRSDGEVASCRCPKIDPAKNRLVSIRATLHGRRTLAVAVQSPTVQDVTVSVSGNMLLDPPFAWPASGSATVQAGPLGSQVATVPLSAGVSKLYTDKLVLGSFSGTGTVTLLSSNNWKPSVSGGAGIQSLSVTSNVTSVHLVYGIRPLLVPDAPIGRVPGPKGGSGETGPTGKPTLASLLPRTVACVP